MGDQKPFSFGATSPFSSQPSFTFGPNPPSSTQTSISFTPSSNQTSFSSQPASAGSFSLGVQPKITTSNPSTSFSFRNPSSGIGTGISTPTTSTGTTTGTQPTPPISFGGSSTPTNYQLMTSTQPSTNAGTQPTPSFSFGGNSSTTQLSSSGANSNLSFSGGTSMTISQDLLKNKPLQSLINEWTMELESVVDEFNAQALKVTQWDRQINHNSYMLLSTYKQIQEVSRSQVNLENNLEIIESKQFDISKSLDELEREINILEDISPIDTPIDLQREFSYQQAERINTQLDIMSEILLNVTQKQIERQKTQEVNPVAQIYEILNHHLSTLQCVDSQTSAIGDKINELQRALEDQNDQNKMFQDRSIQI